MRKVILIILILLALSFPVYADIFVDDCIPMEAETYIVDNHTNFWNDLCLIINRAVKEIRPDIADAARICLKVIAVTLVGSLLCNFTSCTRMVAKLVVTISTGLLLFDSGYSLMELGKNTVYEITEYGKIILPVLTASLAAQGAATASTVLYTGTAIFSTTLSAAMSRLLIPLVYLYLCVCVANNVLSDEMLKRIRELIKWVLTWSLKIFLYVFTGYMTISGVISGTVDASALKATKLAISGAVPVVGNILADASETILLSAGVMKNSVGLYGFVVVMSLIIGPFLKIGVHYAFAKGTAMICSVFSGSDLTGFVDDYASAMGFVLAMTGTSCVLIMVGIVCMMKGVG